MVMVLGWMERTKLIQVAGQMVNLPTVVKSTSTHRHDLLSIKAAQTTDGAGKETEADEIQISFKHTFEFKSPLPKSASSVTMDSTLFIYSTEAGIVRFSDRPEGKIPDNSVLSVSQDLGIHWLWCGC
jgi:hypothetical protein